MKIVRKEDKPTVVNTYTPVRSLIDDFFMMDDFFNRPMVTSLNADVWEEDENVMIKMALPGVKKEDISIEINADMITIKGGSKREEEDSKRYYFKSLETHFEQCFNLPAVVDADKAEANYSDGILSVKLPKAEEYKPKSIKVG